MYIFQVTFEGLWSRNTHPKDFPSNGWLTRFSDVIGASHTKNYTFWNYGEYASEGLRQVAENGNTRMLESELKAKVNFISYSLQYFKAGKTSNASCFALNHTDF